MPLYQLMIIGFAATALLLWGGRVLALRCGFADKPGGRKRHENPVPPIGGLVIIPVFLVLSYFAGLTHSIVPWPLATGLLAILAMGAIDDARSIPSQIKFALIILIACFVVIFGHAEIKNLGNLFGFGEVFLGAGSTIFTVLSLALLMNAINMMDGVDGLSGGFCALATFMLMAVCSAGGNVEAFNALALLLAIIVGFLLFNMRAPWRKSASVFMGDSGALSLGLLLGWFCIKLPQEGGVALEPATVIWVIAVPIMDAFALFLARSLRGLHPFHADRNHLHHRLQDHGLSPGQVTAAILGIVLLFSFAGLMAQALHVPDYVLFYGWLVLFTLHTIGILRILKRNVNKDGP